MITSHGAHARRAPTAAARAAASTCRTRAIPQHLAWILHVIWPRPSSCGAWREGARRYLVKNWLQGSPDTDVTGHIADLMLPCELVGRAGCRCWGMGRDIPDGRMFLRNGRLDIDWKRSAPDRVLRALRNTSRDFAHALGGRFADNPMLVPASA